MNAGLNAQDENNSDEKKKDHDARDFYESLNKPFSSPWYDFLKGGVLLGRWMHYRMISSVHGEVFRHRCLAFNIKWKNKMQKGCSGIWNMLSVRLLLGFIELCQVGQFIDFMNLKD